jgi:hypothetical protein
MKLTPTTQVILAAVLVLAVFLVALLSSIPKKETVSKTGPAYTQQEVRDGTQIARVTITKPGQSASDLPPSPIADTTKINVASTGTAEQTVAAAPATGRAVFAANRVKFNISSFQKLAVQPLKFKVFDENGKELTPEYLQTVREQKVHLIIVSSDLKGYQHLNPQYANGTWNASANLPTPGTYEAYVDVSPVKGNPVVLRSELIVRAATKGNANNPGLTPNMLAISNGVSTVLNLALNSLGTSSTFSYSLTRDGKNVTDIGPMNGSYGYVVVLRHSDPDAFLTGDFARVFDSKGIVEFNVMLRKTGRFTAFAEFKVGNKVLVFPITFDIK